MQPPFSLSQADDRPMYIQIMEHIRQRIIVGQWVSDHPLPSIRELAVSIQVSVITVKRAYQELEREGVIYTRAGKGSFVSPQIDNAAQIKRDELAQHLQAAVRIARLLKQPIDEVVAKLEQLYAEETPEHSHERDS